MRNPDSTLDSIWPTVVHRASLLRLSGPLGHARSETVQRRPDRGPQGARREPCNWCGAPGHDESQCYSKDPGNLLLHPPRQGWLGGVVPERFRLKYHYPLCHVTPMPTRLHVSRQCTTLQSPLCPPQRVSPLTTETTGGSWILARLCTSPLMLQGSIS
jgi:hypothetical protein